jgi:hypothetical protein
VRIIYEFLCNASSAAIDWDQLLRVHSDVFVLTGNPGCAEQITQIVSSQINILDIHDLKKGKINKLQSRSVL